MAGGLIQLVARGLQDLFLIDDPQITFFKVVYRRHTNFSSEPIPQFFIHTPDFGKRISCVLSRSGDLIRNVHLVVTLPRIPTFVDENNNPDVISKVAWVRRIGYALIKRVEIEIGAELIDTQYGDWLNIWNELTIPMDKQMDVMLGDVKELYEYTNGKPSYKLFIPLQFWFNRSAGLAIPVACLQYNHIKINLEIQPLDKLYTLAPTRFIAVDNDFVNFEPFEYVEQLVNGITSIGRFVHFDIVNRRLYIQRITDEPFQSLTVADVGTQEVQQDQILYAKDSNGDLINGDYLIKGLTSKFEAMPLINVSETTYRNDSVRFSTIVLKDAFLLVEYIFLDEEERVRFIQGKHEYLIEQVLFNGEKTIDGVNQSFKMGFTQPCKELIWVTQLSLALNKRNNDYFNYTDSMVRSVEGKLIGKNIGIKGTLLFNGHERITYREIEYFSWVQAFQNHMNSPNEGISMYSFCLHPEKHQPSGTANFSKIDSLLLRLSVNTDIDFTNTAKLRIYARVYNILRIANGISGLVFSNDR